MIIDGKKIAGEIRIGLERQVKGLNFQPLFCDVVVGDDPVSLSYVKIKGRVAKQLGMQFELKQFDAKLSQEELIREITELNRLPNICGLIIQLPLPEGFNRQECLNAIDPKLDVDCIGQVNSAGFYQGSTAMLPPTAAAVLTILDSLNMDLSQKNILVLGQGELVGKPVSFLLKQRGFKVTGIDRSTKDLERLLKQADVIVSGTGQPKLVKGENLKPGCAVIDAGTAESGGSIVGDVDFESAKDIAGFITPVPGGVGPVTVAKLLENVVKVAVDKV